MIAVLAGTPIDTAMGVDFIQGKGYAAKGYAVSRTPEEQSLLQVVYPERLTQEVDTLLGTMKRDGAHAVFVYCNSISAAVDMDNLARKHQIFVVTPLHVYIDMGKTFSCLGVLAANNQSTHGIERAIQTHNPHTQVIGTGMLKLVNAIEEKKAPEEIIREASLLPLLHFYRENGCEAVILGCTHFSYLHGALSLISPLPLVDPAEKMLQRLLENDEKDEIED